MGGRQSGDKTKKISKNISKSPIIGEKHLAIFEKSGSTVPFVSTYNLPYVAFCETSRGFRRKPAATHRRLFLSLAKIHHPFHSPPPSFHGTLRHFLPAGNIEISLSLQRSLAGSAELKITTTNLCSRAFAQTRYTSRSLSRKSEAGGQKLRVVL